MAKKKKKKQHKQLRRTQRLDRGKNWLNTYQGEDISNKEKINVQILV